MYLHSTPTGTNVFFLRPLSLKLFFFIDLTVKKGQWGIHRYTRICCIDCLHFQQQNNIKFKFFSEMFYAAERCQLVLVKSRLTDVLEIVKLSCPRMLFILARPLPPSRATGWWESTIFVTQDSYWRRGFERLQTYEIYESCQVEFSGDRIFWLQKFGPCHLKLDLPAFDDEVSSFWTFLKLQWGGCRNYRVRWAMKLFDHWI